MTAREDEATAEKKSNFFQTLNTVILTVIAILATFISVSVSEIKREQSENAKELIRLNTIQQENVARIKAVETQTNTIMYNFKYDIQVWTDANFRRK